jgi:ribosomal protein S18 acetylase RimI-like enzyme
MEDVSRGRAGHLIRRAMARDRKALGGDIRRAVPRDLDGVAALWTALLEHHAARDPVFALRPDADAEVRRWVGATLRDPDAAIFVWDSASGLAGFCAVRIDRAPGILVEADRAEITDLLVREDDRRVGVGRALVERALRWVVAQGVERCEVRVAARNAEGQGFWRSLDFGVWMDVLERRL